MPVGLTLVDWRQLRAEYERRRHALFPDGNGGYHARTHYHGWQARFDGMGFDLTPDTAPWTWGLELASWGRDGRTRTVSGKARIHTDVNRLEYRRTGITEWYVNGKDGLEHGFTIPDRPEGAGSELHIDLRVRGNLAPGNHRNGQAIEYTAQPGGIALHYRNLLVTDARGRRLPARMAQQGPLLRIAVDDRLAVYPINVDPIVQQAYLKASNTGATDRFGYSVAIAGDTVVVSADQEDSNATGVNGDQSNNTAINAGAAYVFVRSGGTWSQQAYLKASNTGAGDAFGTAVAIHGDTIVVGADKEDSRATGVNGDEHDECGGDSGAAYVFVRTGSTWAQQAYLKASNTGSDDRFGFSTAILGNTLVVGAQGEDSNAAGINGVETDDSAMDAGAAYVFVRSGGAWTQQAYLKASNPGAIDLFGASVALAGESLVVGAWGEDSNATGVNGNQNNESASNAGAAYVFVRSAGVWTQQAYLKASNAEADDNFGFAVAISGDTVVVGAREEDSNATGVNGTQSDNSAAGSGAAYVFVRTATVWTQQAYLKASNPGAGDNFGYSTAIAGDTVVVNARYEGSNATGVNAPAGSGICANNDANCQSGTQTNNGAVEAGAAYVFTRGSGTWNQQAYIKTSNTDTGDRLRVAAIDADTIVLGEWGEDSNATGVNAATGTGGCALNDSACQPGTQSNNAAADSGAGFALRLVVSSLAPTSNTVPGTGATAQVVIVNAESWRPWTATSNAAWLTITAGAAGTGPGSVVYDCAVNPSITSRGAVITINGQAFPVTQSGVTGTLTFSPPSDTATAAGETAKTVTVTANASDFSWIATSNAAWLTISGSASGTGNGAITYNVASNATSVNSRTGTLSIGAQSFSVTQSGVTGSVTLAPTSDTAPPTGATGKTVTVTANATDFPWTAASNAAWLTITGGASGAGSGAVSYNVAANTSINSRTGTLTIGGQTLSVTQNGLTGSVTLSPSSDPATAGAATGKTITVTSNATDFPWTATANAAWLTITGGASGIGNGTVTYNVASNATSVNSRTGTLTIGGQTVTVTQSGVTGAVTPSPSSDTAPGSGAIGKSVLVTSNATDFAWTAASNAPWLTITAGASTTGNGSVTYDVAPSASINSRTGTLSIGGQTVTVTQSGLTGSVTLSPSSDTAAAAGATGKSVTLTSNATDFPWTANSNAPWLTITGGASGTGSGGVTYNVASNGTSVNSRTGTLTIGGQTFTLTQSGVTGSVMLSPSSDTAAAAGATGKSVTLTANATDFAWTATSNAPWLIITSAASGTGSGTVTYNVASNNTSVNSRTGTLTIGAQTLTITQSGVTGSVTLSPSSEAIAPNGAAGKTVTITANATDFAWTAISNAPWLTITGGASGTGNGTVTYNVASNASSVNARTGTLTIGGQTFTITQSGITGSITLAPQSDTAPPSGATGKTVSLTANATDLPWTATSNAAWLTVTSGASGTGNGTVTYNVASNATSINSRTGTLTIGGQTLAITQSGVTSSITLAPQSDTAPATGATGKTVTLTANATDLPWTATASVPWLTITSGATSTGSGTVTYNVASNATSINARTGTITIGGQTFTVTQSGVTGSVSPSPQTDTAPPSGATGKTISVTANATDHPWTATANVPWLTITSGATGTGNGAVAYTVSSNANSVNARTGTLTIGGQIVTVTQSGITGSVTLSPTSDVAPAAGATGRIISATANAPDFVWTATSNTPWLTIIAGATGAANRTVTYNIAANTGAEDRTGTLTIGGKTFSVSQQMKPELALSAPRVTKTFATGDEIAPIIVDLEGTPGLPFTVISDVPWLEVTPKSGVVPKSTDAASLVKLTITPSSRLAPGEYVGTVTVQAEGAEPRVLLVRLSVTEPTQFVALPAALQLDGATPGLVYITSRGRQVAYRAEALSDGGWLSVNPELGTTPVNLRVTANTYFLKPGRYTGTIRVTSMELGGGGPINVPITVDVPPPPGQP